MNVCTLGALPLALIGTLREIVEQALDVGQVGESSNWWKWSAAPCSTRRRKCCWRAFG